MNKGIFSLWFREFATLVFTQTLQAFLLAIVMSIIVACLSGSQTSDGVDAAGLLAIIALSSFSKVEHLVKNIFGVTSSFGDPAMENGKNALSVGGAMALGGVHRLKDNISKRREANRMIKQGRAGMKNESLNQRLKGNQQANLNSGNSNAGNVGENDKIEKKITKSAGGGKISELNNAISELTKAIEKQTQDKQKDKMKEYQDMINKGKQMKRANTLENIGATIGGTMGAVVGLAQGDNILQNTLAGAGVGDTAGQMIAGDINSREEHKQKMNKLMGDYDKSLNEAISKMDDENYEMFKQQMSKEIEQIESDSRGNITGKIAGPVQRKRTMSDMDRRRKEIREQQAENDKNSSVGE